MPWLINPAQLDKFRKSQNNVIILDASVYSDNRSAKEAFIEKHIPGARFFDIDAFSDPSSTLPHMLILDGQTINQKLSQLGLRNDNKIIFYDNSEWHTSCRALWMFTVFGHNPHLLYILDGGLKAWENYSNKIESGDVAYTAKNYLSRLQLNYVRDMKAMKANLSQNIEQIVDVRNPVRYAGGPEPRAGLRFGHVPDSFCLPFQALFTKEGQFLSPDKVKKKLIDIGVDPTAPIVSTCGSGMTAPILNFYLDLLSQEKHAVYDGSWSEWGAEILYPGEESLAERPVATCLEYDRL